MSKPGKRSLIILLAAMLLFGLQTAWAQAETAPYPADDALLLLAAAHSRLAQAGQSIPQNEAQLLANSYQEIVPNILDAAEKERLGARIRALEERAFRLEFRQRPAGTITQTLGQPVAAGFARLIGMLDPNIEVSLAEAGLPVFDHIFCRSPIAETLPLGDYDCRPETENTLQDTIRLLLSSEGVPVASIAAATPTPAPGSIPAPAGLPTAGTIHFRCEESRQNWQKLCEQISAEACSFDIEMQVDFERMEFWFEQSEYAGSEDTDCAASYDQKTSAKGEVYENGWIWGNLQFTRKISSPCFDESQVESKGHFIAALSDDLQSVTVCACLADLDRCDLDFNPLYDQGKQSLFDTCPSARKMICTAE